MQTLAGKRFSVPISLLLAGIFFLGVFCVQSRHELWRDELHSWLIARDSHSLPELLHHKRHEGHPALWYLILFAVTRLSDSPRAMQLIHLLVATASIFLLLRFSPFSRGEKLLLLANYYLFYEYGVLSRNYASGIFFVFAFCALGTRRTRQPCLAALFLLLVMQTSFHGLILALLFAGFLLRECWAGDWSEWFRRIRLPVLILLLGLFVSLRVMIPPPDCGIYTGGHGSWKWSRVFPIGAIPFTSLVPFPYPTQSFWNTNLLDGWPSLQAALALLLAAWLVLALWRRRLLALGFGLGTAVYLLFHYLKFSGYARHHGHVFLLLLGCLWLAPGFPSRPIRSRCLERAVEAASRSLAWLLPAIFALAAAAGLYASRKDWKYPFTDSPAAAAFIRRAGLAELPLAGDVDDAVLAFPILLGTEIYYPRSDTEGTFVTYDRSRRWRKMRYWEILGRVGKKAAASADDFLLILNYDIPSSVLDPWQEEHPPGTPGRLEYLAEFEEGIVPDEHFRLFRVTGAR